MLVKAYKIKDIFFDCFLTFYNPNSLGLKKQLINGKYKNKKRETAISLSWILHFFIKSLKMQNKIKHFWRNALSFMETANTLQGFIQTVKILSKLMIRFIPLVISVLDFFL